MMTLFAALSWTVMALTASAAEPTTTTAEPPKKERLICRTQEKLGSRLGGKRVCNTKARWAEIEADSVAAVRGFQQERQSNPTNGN